MIRVYWCVLFCYVWLVDVFMYCVMMPFWVVCMRELCAIDCWETMCVGSLIIVNVTHVCRYYVAVIAMLCMCSMCVYIREFVLTCLY